MSNKNQLRAKLNRVVAELIEETSADAIIIGITRQRRRRTETIAVPFGNIHTCRGVAEFIYASLCEDPDEDAEETEEGAEREE